MIHYIEDKNEKERIARTILADLPEWFGLPESTEEYIKNSKDFPFWAEFEQEKAIGFISLKETSKHTAELYVMGVLKEAHRKGIGTRLFQTFYNYSKEHGYSFLQVKTVQEGHYKEYDRTRLFYEKLGFKALECFKTLWDEWNPCLILVMAIK